MTLIIGAPRKNPDPRPGQSVLERAAGEGYDFHVASKSGLHRSHRRRICLREIADALEGQAP